MDKTMVGTSGVRSARKRVSATALGGAALAWLGLLGCEPMTAGTDGGGSAGTDAPRDLTGLYAECTGGGCASGQECLPMTGPTRETGLCTVFCAHDAECPGGACVRSMSSSDPRYRCVSTCEADTDCAAGFACFGIFVVTIDGAMTDDLCAPE
jgi:hypothetical protein